MNCFFGPCFIKDLLNTTQMLEAETKLIHIIHDQPRGLVVRVSDY